MIAVSIKKSTILKAITLTLALMTAVASTVFCAFAENPSTPNNGIHVPILMYHSILNDPSRTGKYVITPASLEQDLQYLQSHNYTTIFMTDLINYVYQGTPLPERPIILTFDDGHLNNKTYLYPLLEKYNMKAVISVVGSYTENYSQNPDPNPAYAYLTWEDIRDLSQSDYIEIQNHSYDMHGNQERHGAKKKWNETSEQYKNFFCSDVSKMQQCLEQNSGVCPNTFAYPFGLISEESNDYIKEMGFKASLSCRERENIITQDPNDLYELGRYNRSGLTDTQSIMKKANIA